jgi:hypothetical protein
MNQLEEALFRALLNKNEGGNSKRAIDYLSTLDFDKRQILKQILDVNRHSNVEIANTSTIINNSRNNRNIHKISILRNSDIDENTYM